MKVKDLIELLENQDPISEVLLFDTHDGSLEVPTAIVEYECKAKYSDWGRDTMKNKNQWHCYMEGEWTEWQPELRLKSNPYFELTKTGNTRILLNERR